MIVGIFLAAIISPFVYGFIVNSFLPINSITYNIFYYSIPIFLIFGFIISLAVNRLLKNLNFKNAVYKYGFQFVLYALAGLIFAILLAFVNEAMPEITLLPLVLLGVLPALIYFHFYFALTYLFNRLQLFSHT